MVSDKVVDDISLSSQQDLTSGCCFILGEYEEDTRQMGGKSIILAVRK